jgi:hypothetical protein
MGEAECLKLYTVEGGSLRDGAVSGCTPREFLGLEQWMILGANLIDKVI